MATSIGLKIKELRVRRGLSQDDVAFEVSVSRQTVCKWERGAVQPTTDNIKALCDFFDVTADELLNGMSAETHEAAATCDEISTDALDVEIESDNTYNKKTTKTHTGLIITTIIVASFVFLISISVSGIAIYIHINNNGGFQVINSASANWIGIVGCCLAVVMLIIVITLSVYFVRNNKRKK